MTKKNVTYKKSDGLLYRIVHKIDRISDISIVANPAYYGTDVTLRSLEEIDSSLTDNYYKEQINNLRKFI
ncbi:HK97 family phage prohead protease [Bacteroides fragilis]|nr:HK97 family phage prohead protease [Bacteroides fragilis]